MVRSFVGCESSQVESSAEPVDHPLVQLVVTELERRLVELLHFRLLAERANRTGRGPGCSSWTIAMAFPGVSARA